MQAEDYEIRAVLFDFDGLILETEGPDYQAWEEIFEGYGGSLALPDWAGCIGARAGVFDPPKHLEEQLGRRVDREALWARHRQRFTALVAEKDLEPGVADYVEEAGRRFGLKLAVASSSDRAWVERHLSRFGLLRSFDCVKCVEDVREAKPAPDLYASALEDLGVAPYEAVALEDSPNGIAAAQAAGLYCVAVPNCVTCQLDLRAADLIVDSLAQLPLEVLLARACEACRK
jgi:HAD superfamily hydrolase (TIGR01509 family)